MVGSVVTPEDVLQSLMNDGTIDSFRVKIINQLKGNVRFSALIFQEELKSNTITMVEQSKVLNTPGAEKQSKRELFDALRRDLESQVLEKASKAVWELILNNNGLGKEISEVVEKVYRRLSGIELPPPPPPPPPPMALAADENSVREGDGLKDSEMGESSARKRTFREMNAQDSRETAVNGAGVHHPVA
ncbi:hypothetical protein KSP40_PGU019757 [Platanthera guangdongensis]|uniref:Uncharacterized protein n=1 Tax=Platanthera guangdongensis TaxID=2320717 RepID=A0ABR2MPR8_9ASPA